MEGVGGLVPLCKEVVEVTDLIIRFCMNFHAVMHWRVLINRGARRFAIDAT